MLHGLTVPGRLHPTLLRFAAGIARTGAAVLLPDIPAWRRLRIDREAGTAVILQSLSYLESRSDLPGPVTVMGGSFGATQALLAAATPQATDRIQSVMAFGGYCSLLRTVHFMFTGEHGYAGQTYRNVPDPYGRWIIAANYLDHVDIPGSPEIAKAARDLAQRAGEDGIFAGDPIYDELKTRLARNFDDEQQEVWEVIAPPARVPPDRDRAAEIAGQLHEAALDMDRIAEPEDVLGDVKCRVIIAHGQEDRLVPYTEALCLREALTGAERVDLGITRLFSHSEEAGRIDVAAYPGEVVKYLRLLGRALADP